MIDVLQLQRMLTNLQDQITAVDRMMKQAYAIPQMQQQNKVPEVVKTPEPQVQVVQEQSAQTGMLLKLMEEFSKENETDAKALAALVQKFGRYVQSKAAKSASA